MLDPCKGVVVEKISPTRYLVQLHGHYDPTIVRYSAKYVMIGVELKTGDKVLVQQSQYPNLLGFILSKSDLKGTSFKWPEGQSPEI